MNLKQRIKFDFNKAANSYDGHASLQRAVADRLFKLFCSTINPTADSNILDLGCGTGYFHELARKNRYNWHITQLDLAYNMCQLADSYSSNKSFTICADMEKLPFEQNSFNHIFSSLAIQWSNSLNCLFAEIQHTLQPGGFAAFSTLAPSTLNELEFCFNQIDSFNHINSFIPYAEILAQAERWNLKNIKIAIDQIVVFHPTVLSIMQNLTKVGAGFKGSFADKSLYGKNKLKLLETIYKNNFGTEEGLPVTWQIYSLIFQKE